MEKKAVSGIMLTLLSISMLTLAFNIQPVRASGTIYIKPDGSVEGTDKIQRDGDVYTFTDNIYDEIVVERDNIVVDGAGYTVRGAGSGTGIDLRLRNNVTIKNMEIGAFYHGIYLSSSSDNRISGNNITNSYDGIWLDDSLNNTISGNNVTLSTQPIPEDVGCGIVLLFSSSYNTISGNNVTNTFEGIKLQSSSSYNNISGNKLENNYYGITVSLSTNYNSVSGNTVTAGRSGVYLMNCLNNIVSGNSITANSNHGILLHPKASNNTLSENYIKNNDHGITLFRSSNNFIYHNNLDNTVQVYFYESGPINVWDDGYPSGGNYWSDYEDRYPEAEELDDSGIWDTPYVIDENNQDNYPLMEPWSTSTMIKTLIRTVRFWNLHKGTENRLTSKLKGALHLLDTGKENGAVHKLMGFIDQAESFREKKLTDEQADYLISEARRILTLIEDNSSTLLFF